MALKPGWEGRYLEDFEVGDVYRSSIGRTITEFDNISFTLLTNNDNQIHFNTEYAKRTPFGKPLVNSLLTIAVVTGLTVTDISRNGVNLGWDKVRLPHPLYAGDTIWAESEVLSVRESQSDSRRGIVHIKTRGIQQEGEIVIEFERSILVWKRAHAPSIDAFPEPKRS
ncbi:MAG: MaoC family dehydratase [Dehalococcoidia bacterium]